MSEREGGEGLGGSGSGSFAPDMAVQIKRKKQCKSESHRNKPCCDLSSKGEMLNKPFVSTILGLRTIRKSGYLPCTLIVQSHSDDFLQQLIVGDPRMSSRVGKVFAAGDLRIWI